MSKKDTLDLSTPIFVTGIGTDVGKTIVSALANGSQQTTETYTIWRH